MSLIDTIPQTDVTVPAFLRGAPNGDLPADWLRSPEISTALHRQLFVAVSYAMQAMHIAAADDAVLLRTTGRYRTYPQQVTLFKSRYRSGAENDTGCGSKIWDGIRWYMQRNPATGRCYAMAAVPGTSNHGLGLADDIAEQDDADPEVESIDDVTLQWLADNAVSFGFALDIHAERWHWHWWNGDALTQRTVDVLHAAGITIPDLTAFGFYVPPPTDTTPPPTPTEEDDMGRMYIARLDTNPNLIVIGDGVNARRVRAAQTDELTRKLAQGTGVAYYDPKSPADNPVRVTKAIPTLTADELLLELGYELEESTP